MFLNITNHPSTDWPQAQRAAAMAIASPITDLPFPNVPPEADEIEVESLGREILEKTSRFNPSAALVEGDFTLTYFLVRELMKRGVVCYIATTPRITAVKLTGPHSSEKVSQFHFTRLRRYQ